MIMPSEEKTAPSFQFSSHMRCDETQPTQARDEAPVWLRTFRLPSLCVTYPDLPMEPTEHTCMHRYLPVRFTTCADACAAITTAAVPIIQNSIFIWPPRTITSDTRADQKSDDAEGDDTHRRPHYTKSYERPGEDHDREARPPAAHGGQPPRQDERVRRRHATGTGGRVRPARRRSGTALRRGVRARRSFHRGSGSGQRGAAHPVG